MSGGSRHGQRRLAQPAQHRSSGGAADAQRLTTLLEPVVRALDMDLEGIKVVAAGRRRLLRVVVDADGGVSLDDIALASRELSAKLDKAEAMGEQPYTLEVSSPGVDRPLTQPRHWRRAVGRLVKVQLAENGAAGAAADEDAVAEGATFDGPVVEGRVAGTSEHGVTLEVAGEPREYRYAELGPARVQVEFGHFDAGQDDDDLAEDDLDGAEGAREEGSDGH
jgi:ribosome maturation factor RimP